MVNSMDSQTREFLDINQIRAGINANGDLFSNLDDNHALFEAPKEKGTTAIFAASLWIGGYDDNGILHVAAQTYRQNNSVDYWSGPVAKSYNNLYDNMYNRVWKISRHEIETHINRFNLP